MARLLGYNKSTFTKHEKSGFANLVTKRATPSKLAKAYGLTIREVEEAIGLSPQHICEERNLLPLIETINQLQLKSLMTSKFLFLVRMQKMIPQPMSAKLANELLRHSKDET